MFASLRWCSLFIFTEDQNTTKAFLPLQASTVELAHPRIIEIDESIMLAFGSKKKASKWFNAMKQCYG